MASLEGLEIERCAVHDVVARCEDRIARIHDRGYAIRALERQPWLPARAVKVCNADVEISDHMRPSHREVDVIASRAGLVGGPIRIHERLGTQAPIPPRIRPLAKPGQHEPIFTIESRDWVGIRPDLTDFLT